MNAFSLFVSLVSNTNNIIIIIILSWIVILPQR